MKFTNAYNKLTLQLLRRRKNGFLCKSNLRIEINFQEKIENFKLGLTFGRVHEGRELHNVGVCHHEGIVLVPDVAAHPKNPPAYLPREQRGHLADDSGEAPPALRRRQVRCALRERVDVHLLRREPGPPRGVPPAHVAGLVGDRGHEPRHQGVERGDVRVEHVVHVLRGTLRLVSDAGEEVLVGVPELALVVVHGDVAAGEAVQLGVAEPGLEARRAAAARVVPAAEHEPVHRARRAAAEGPRREARRRGVPRERAGEVGEVGGERAAGLVGPPDAGGVAVEGDDGADHRQRSPGPAVARRRCRRGRGGGEEEDDEGQGDKHDR